MGPLIRQHNRAFSWVLISTFAALLIGIVVTKIADYDFWWHLNLGRQILDKMTPVVVDQFSYTFSGPNSLMENGLPTCSST